MKVYRIQNASALKDPEVRALLTASEIAHGNDEPEAFLTELAQGAALPHIGAFVGHDGGHFTTFMLTTLPIDHVNPCPMVLRMYNTGPSRLRTLVFKEAIAFAKAHGYNRCRLIDSTKSDQKVYKRWLRRHGEVRPIGNVYEYQFK